MVAPGWQRMSEPSCERRDDRREDVGSPAGHHARPTMEPAAPADWPLQLRRRDTISHELDMSEIGSKLGAGGGNYTSTRDGSSDHPRVNGDAAAAATVTAS